MGGRNTTHLEHWQSEMECFRIPHSPRWMVWWSKTQTRGVDIIETLHTRYYYGRVRAGSPFCRAQGTFQVRGPLHLPPFIHLPTSYISLLLLPSYLFPHLPFFFSFLFPPPHSSFSNFLPSLPFSDPTPLSHYHLTHTFISSPLPIFLFLPFFSLFFQ